MPPSRDQFRTSYGTFMARERELERTRARRDAGPEGGDNAGTSDGTPASPRGDGGAKRSPGA
jgi:hypothetical protein